MLDEMDRLRNVGDLYDLLTHYAALGAPDRQVWQDRQMPAAGAEPARLTKLHGELVAFGWLEQNTGLTPLLRPTSAPACYRITPAGGRALKQVRAERAEAA
jgi:hypothetical protein